MARSSAPSPLHPSGSQVRASRRRPPIRAHLLAAILLCAGLLGMRPAAPPEPLGPRSAAGLRLAPVAAGLEHPVHLAAPAKDPRLFIVEQPGRIRIVRDGRLIGRPFLDLTDRVRDGGERGLLGLAFHPDYSRNGWFFVNYTDSKWQHARREYTVTSDPDLADPGSAHTILGVVQPYANHNGGHVLFGPMACSTWAWATAAAGRPAPERQNLASLLGKLLRIDVDRGDPYAVPPDKPVS